MENRTPATTVLGVSAIVLVIAAFLPWATVSALGASISVNGLDGSDGYITIICGAYLGFIAWRAMQRQPVSKGMVIGMWVAAGIATAIGVMNFSSVDDNVGAAALAGVSASVGIGLWLTILGGLGALAGTFLFKKEATAGGGPMGPAGTTGTTPPSSPF